MTIDTMRAVRMTAWGEPAQVLRVRVPEPQGAELLIEVRAAGLCRSDLHVMDAPAGVFDYPLPLTLGHEVAGTVVGAGPDADSSWIGQSVVVHGVWSCGQCRNCRRGRENYCHDLRPRADGLLPAIGSGLGYDGGLADAMIVPSERFVVRTRGLAPESAAPLADAALTAYHAIRTNRDLVDSHSVVVVVGVGGLGHLAVQILRALGAGTVVAVDPREGSRDLARRLGADRAVPEVADVARADADVVFDFVGSPATMDSAAQLLGPGGRLVTVGSGGGRLTVGKNLGLPNGWQVSAPFWGTRADLEAVVDLAHRGQLSVESAAYRLDDALDVYDRLRRGAITGRAVLVP
ncbi:MULTISPECIES: NAD(P)-dependent alcohol dehydrogenase [unclassified Rhodococcus (in: high G+C Gram-positive bacteria)]|uniref:NAD(P)-dependent alcohol dehydrogenase n=1 Tax=unclassified Rhodococcus (in: high G+C Gram-positive bacteria) TaxID=192944 RepID=UPI0016396EB3|nr:MULTISPECIES: NAD(P)-dependent alcohol dehydrogenase [unclassified Rhodococcus (in: high G+C Gram-positive bacteria)]MBC2639943.1 NAD(P)-dependent alcohol dehydrogenase [Rhodococcus sp. 3A]MBC2895310.1 NAD(P)-dependent alcohol dehydrogenase [Rhodococcus sp. 4CII]